MLLRKGKKKKEKDNVTLVNQRLTDESCSNPARVTQVLTRPFALNEYFWAILIMAKFNWISTATSIKFQSDDTEKSNQIQSAQIKQQQSHKPKETAAPPIPKLLASEEILGITSSSSIPPGNQRMRFRQKKKERHRCVALRMQFPIITRRTSSVERIVGHLERKPSSIELCFLCSRNGTEQLLFSRLIS